MEKEQNTVLYKIRSYSSCFKEGFDLLTNNFKLLFMYLWLPMLIYSAFATFLSQYMPIMAQDIQSGATSITSVTVIGSILFVGSLLVSSLLSGYLFTLLNKLKELGYLPDASARAHKKEIIHYFVRSIKVYLWELGYVLLTVVIIGLLLAALFALVGGSATIVRMVFAVLIIVAISLAAFIPLWYLATKYMMEDGTGFIKMMTTSLGTAMRHWGKLFVLTVITGIVAVTALTITGLPNYLMIIVSKLSTDALADGDPSGLPGGFTFFSSLVFFLCYFLQVFVHVFVVFPFLFMYGSIEAEEKERGELEKAKSSEDGVIGY